MCNMMDDLISKWCKTRLSPDFVVIPRSVVTTSTLDCGCLRLDINMVQDSA